MHASPEPPYLPALESAIDELAAKLRIEPIELRRRNDAQQSRSRGLPYTSRGPMQCFDEAADSVGWAIVRQFLGAGGDYGRLPMYFSRVDLSRSGQSSAIKMATSASSHFWILRTLNQNAANSD